MLADGVVEPGDEADRFEAAAHAKQAVGDGAVEVETRGTFGGGVQPLGVLEAVEGDDPRVVVAVVGADQIDRDAALDEGEGVQGVFHRLVLPGLLVVHPELFAAVQGLEHGVAHCRVDLRRQQWLPGGQGAYLILPVAATGVPGLIGLEFFFGVTEHGLQGF
nr:hypothetical protein [Methylococcus capsulatus]